MMLKLQVALLSCGVVAAGMSIAAMRELGAEQLQHLRTIPNHTAPTLLMFPPGFARVLQDAGWVVANER